MAPARLDADYVFSPAGLRVAAVTMQGSRLVVLVNSEPGPLFDQMLRLDGQAFYGRRSGINTAEHAAPVVVTRDGKRFAYVGRQGDEMVVVDGKELTRFPKVTTLRYGPLGFSPGGRHVHFVASDTMTGLSVVIDGQAGLVLGATPTALALSRDDPAQIVPGQADLMRQSRTIGDDGSLSFLAWDGADMKRYRITPAADIGVETLLAAATGR